MTVDELAKALYERMIARTRKTWDWIAAASTWDELEAGGKANFIAFAEDALDLLAPQQPKPDEGWRASPTRSGPMDRCAACGAYMVEHSYRYLEGPYFCPGGTGTFVAAPNPDEGWLMVPVEPTREIFDAIWKASGNPAAGEPWPGRALALYTAMLAAAPKPDRAGGE